MLPNAKIRKIIRFSFKPGKLSSHFTRDTWKKGGGEVKSNMTRVNFPGYDSRIYILWPRRASRVLPHSRVEKVFPPHTIMMRYL